MTGEQYNTILDKLQFLNIGVCICIMGVVVIILILMLLAGGEE